MVVVNSEEQIYSMAKSSRVQQSQLIEIIVRANSTGVSLPFPDQPNLRSVFLQAIKIYTADMLPYSVVSGTPLITSDQVKLMFMNLYANDKQAMANVPLIEFMNINDNNAPYQFMPWHFNGHAVSWNKTTINFAQALGNTTDVSILINVFFVDPLNIISPETQLQFVQRQTQ